MGTGSTPRRISTLVVEPPGGTLGELLAGHEEFELTSAASAQEAVDLAARIRPDVIVADPELPDSWPATMAETLLARYRGHVPVIFVCRSAADAALLEKRFGGPAVVILVRADVPKGKLPDVVRGRAAEKRTN